MTNITLFGPDFIGANAHEHSFLNINNLTRTAFRLACVKTVNAWLEEVGEYTLTPSGTTSPQVALIMASDFTLFDDQGRGSQVCKSTQAT